jgi:uncharacterized protein YktA (UPF0223 family)
MSEMLQHLLMFYKYGGKQLYYFNTYDGQGEIVVDDQEEEKTREDFNTQEEYDEYCESCVL